MSKEHIVNLDNISLLKEFINEVTYHIKSDVDAIYDRQVVDAKSLLGVMSIAINPLRVVIHSDDLSEVAYFAHICEKFK